MDFISYGVTSQNKAVSELDLLVEEVKIKGFSVLKNVLNEQELAEARKRLDDLYAKQEKEFGVDNLVAIKEKDMARCLLAHDEFFLRKLAVNPRVMEAVEKFLGDYFILHLQNGIINRAQEAHHQSSWHRDLPYQNFVISKPLSINAMFCIDDFTVENGCTWVVPFSHREEMIPTVDYIERNKAPLVAPAGSVVIFDSMLFHQAGYNASKNTRRGINNVYVAPILKQQIDLPKILKGKYADDPFLYKFLGYGSEVASSDVEFRQFRWNKMNPK